jgi:hypothetical protein
MKKQGKNKGKTGSEEEKRRKVYEGSKNTGASSFSLGKT